MRHRPAAVGRGLTGHSDNLRQLFRSEPGRRSRTGLILQEVGHQLRKILLFGWFFLRVQQTRLVCSPPIPPPPHPLPVHSEASRLLLIRQSLS
jgi:hypothetical protein